MSRSATLLIFLVLVANLAAADRSRTSYRQLVQEDKPVAYWTFDGSKSDTITSHVGDAQLLQARVIGQLKRDAHGPRPPEYPAFSDDNRAIQFSGQKGFLGISDPGSESLLDFTNGDAISLEAWVNPTAIADGQYAYVLGKGRTNRAGFASENQNYALRIQGTGAACCLSFLFRNATNKTRDDYHRWTSKTSFPLDGEWHHIAITYLFGQPDSLCGYIDGQRVTGEWDMGGRTSQAPVVDDDELWIGSALGGNASSTFKGQLDEVAIYRSIVPPERMQLRYQHQVPDPPSLAELLATASDQHVTVQLYENVPNRAWPKRLPKIVGTTYEDVAFGFVRIPKKYVAGLSSKRSNPYLLQATSKIKLPSGKYRFLLRSRSAARLLLDNQVVLANGFMNRNSSGHEAVPKLSSPTDEAIVALAAGGQESAGEFQLDAGWHHVELQSVIGGKGQRAEVGELVVALAKDDEPFRLLAPQTEFRAFLDDASWSEFTRTATTRIAQVEQQARRSTTDVAYWERRHDQAKVLMATRQQVAIPANLKDLPGNNEVDALLNPQIRAAGVTPTPLTNDYEFLRRVTLDLTGVPPSRAEIAEFLIDQTPNRRARAIDRLLQTAGWADNWVGYWQDVLAENPGILKPKLNNSGPFRWWIYESLYDNKPFDQWVTELVMMQGDAYSGAPAGFGVATQNDIPMAAKAHVLSQAFLGLNLQCARCHDAPYHPFKQADLLGIAALLNRKAIELPATSTVPQAEGARKPLVQVSLQPGAQVAGVWPFQSLGSIDDAAKLVRNPEDPRERLAATLTSPHNDRFAQVIVNRLWARYFGKGIVDPVDDWHLNEPSHPALLDYLARQLVSHRYDLKHVTRLILNSHAYQRKIATRVQPSAELEKWFAAPGRRRLTAEQIVDSLYAAAGKTMGAEALTLDPEGRRGVETFLNLGFPTRAWQLTSLSNERDRPALALPVAQSIVDVLSTFGWRDARPNPITVREQSTTVLQPLTIANGTMPHRIVQISDNSAFTALALQDISVEELVDQLFLQIVSRPASTVEREPLVTLLRDGFDHRRTDAPPITLRRKSNQVSWSNHLSKEATQIKLALERAARRGDPPTNRLRADWRERYEDVVWALVNSPETMFLP